MDRNYSNEIKIVVNYALEEAARLGSFIATPDHLFLGILRYRESDAVKILEERKNDRIVIDLRRKLFGV